jgi:hypothetical protein
VLPLQCQRLVLNEVNSVTDPVKKALQRIEETLRGMQSSVVPVAVPLSLLHVKVKVKVKLSL